MRISIFAAVLVVERLERRLSRPALFDERMPPARLRARRDRVMGWLGPLGEHCVADYLRRGTRPDLTNRTMLHRWTSSAGAGDRHPLLVGCSPIPSSRRNPVEAL